MALEWQNVSISLSKGLDLKSDPKQVVQGKMLQLQNSTFQSSGRYKKRNGFGVINSTLSSGNAISSYDNELVATDGTNVYSYGEQLGDMTLRGKKIACDISVSSVVRNSNQQTHPDSAVLNGILCFGYSDSSGVGLYTILDQVTNKIYVNGAQIGTSASSIKVNTVGTSFIISFVEAGSPATLKYLAVNCTTFSATPGTIGAMGVADSSYDVSFVGSNLVYAYSGQDVSLGTPCIYIVSLNSSLTLGTKLEYSASTTQKTVFDNGSGQAVVGFNNGGTAVQFILCNAGITSYAGPYTIETISGVQNITGISSSNGPLFFYEVINTTGSTSDNFVRKCQVTGVTAGTPSDLLRSVGLWSKPFLYSGSAYLAVAHESALQSCYFVIDSTGIVISQVALENGGGLSSNAVLRQVNAISSNEVQFAYLIKDFVSSINGNVYTQTGVNSLSLIFGGPIITQEIGNNLNLSGGVASMYDGNIVVEKNFHLYPEGDSVTAQPLGGGLSTGKYQYCEVYEWTDNQGQIHQSATSIPTTLDTGLNKIYNTVGYSSGSSLYATSGGGWNFLSPGALISGSGVPGNLYIVSGTTRGLNSAPALGAGTQFTITPGKGFDYSAVIGSEVITLTQLYSVVAFGSISNTSNIFTLKQATDIVPGMRLLYFNGSSDTEITVSSVNGLFVTLASTPSVSVDSGSFELDGYIVGSVTNGSPVLTVTYSGPFDSSLVGRLTDTGKTITGVAGNLITFNSAFTFTSSSYGTSFYVNQNPPLVGEVYTDLGGCFSGTVTIKSIVGNQITLDQQAYASTAHAYGSTFVTPAALSSSVVVPTLRVTNKPGVSLALYRTEVNQDIFYRH
jgi:hypothetical protein